MSDTKKKYPKAAGDALAVCRKITHSLATSIQEMLAHLIRSWLSFQIHSMAHGPPNTSGKGRAGQGQTRRRRTGKGIVYTFYMKWILMCCIIWFGVKTGLGNQITNFRFCTRMAASGKLGNSWTKENNIQWKSKLTPKKEQTNSIFVMKCNFVPISRCTLRTF